MTLSLPLSRARLRGRIASNFLATALIATSATLHASTRVTNACDWYQPSGLSSVNFNVGTQYVPRDAPIGSVIGQVDIPSGFLDGLRAYECHSDGTVRHEMRAVPSIGIEPGPFPPIGGEDTTGKILRTNVPGVGVRITLRDPYDGTISTYWHVDAGSTVPFDAYIQQTIFLPLLGYLRAVATLVKTGDIAPGPQVLNGEVVSASILRSIGRIWGINLVGTVHAAQCSVPVNPVDADPVDLGDWSTGDFTAPGDTTVAKPFTITLSDCVSDPRPGGTITTAHIHLQPSGGSTTLDAELGLLSLGTGSGATGLAIQMLSADGRTPVALDREVPLRAIEPTGSTVLPLSARFRQVGERVTPGTAKGSVNFTISYK